MAPVFVLTPPSDKTCQRFGGGEGEGGKNFLKWRGKQYRCRNKEKKKESINYSDTLGSCGVLRFSFCSPTPSPSEVFNLKNVLNKWREMGGGWGLKSEQTLCASFLLKVGWEEESLKTDTELSPFL